MKAKEFIPTTKPRNFVAKNAMKTTSGAGAHRDKKKEQKQGYEKHKNKSMTEMDKSQPSSDRGGESSGDPYAKGSKAKPVKTSDFAKVAKKTLDKALNKEHKKGVEEANKIPFAGAAVGHKEGPAGQWRNKGPKANKPAKPGDLVGG